MKNDHSAPEPMVKVEALEKRFPGREAPVLCDLSLEVSKGDLVLVMGRSGSGKSTLLHCIAGLESFNAGEVIVAGESFSRKGVEELAKFRLRHMGVVFQFFNLIGSLTIEENILLPAYLAGKRRADVDSRMKELRELVGISHVLHQFPHEVSGGEAQRTAIARALLLKPELLLADEPTGNLDERNAEIVMQLFESLVSEFGITVIMVSHERSLVSSAYKVYEMTSAGALQCKSS